MTSIFIVLFRSYPMKSDPFQGLVEIWLACHVIE